MKAKAGISRLVVLFILVLPVSAMAWSIGDIDFDLLGERINIKINPVNQMKATMIHRYPDPIKVVIIMASRCGQGNKICVDNIYYIKDDTLNGYRSIGGKYEIEALAPERAMVIYNEIIDYIGKLSLKPSGGLPITLVANEPSIGSKNHIDFQLLTRDKLIGHEHIKSPTGDGEICKQTFRYDVPINVVQIFIAINGKSGRNMLISWQYFKDGEFFLFEIDMDIFRKFGRAYYPRKPVTPERLLKIKAEFNRFLNPI